MILTPKILDEGEKKCGKFAAFHTINLILSDTRDALVQISLLGRQGDRLDVQAGNLRIAWLGVSGIRVENKFHI